MPTYSSSREVPTYLRTLLDLDRNGLPTGRYPTYQFPSDYRKDETKKKGTSLYLFSQAAMLPGSLPGMHWLLAGLDLSRRIGTDREPGERGRSLTFWLLPFCMMETRTTPHHTTGRIRCQQTVSLALSNAFISKLISEASRSLEPWQTSLEAMPLSFSLPQSAVDPASSGHHAAKKCVRSFGLGNQGLEATTWKAPFPILF